MTAFPAPPASRTATPRPALTARWTNLLLITYRAPEALLRRYLHPALELDRWEGMTHVSLVAFDFEQTRIFGLRIPGFEHFPEINLRTYVRFGDARGVVFVRELVPSRITAGIARLWYNEPYRAVPLRSEVTRTAGRLRARRSWRSGGREHVVDVEAAPDGQVPPASDVEHHFKEHEWGFGRTRDGRLLRYRVTHPVWAVHEVTGVDVSVGFGTTYGDDWSFLDSAAPASVIFAAGSPVSVFRPTIVDVT